MTKKEIKNFLSILHLNEITSTCMKNKRQQKLNRNSKNNQW